MSRIFRTVTFVGFAIVVSLAPRCAGATTERVSVSTTGDQGDGDSIDAAISADGRFVAFWGNATNLVSDDTNGLSDVFVHDRQTGTTERVSVDSSGAQGTPLGTGAHRPAISADGRFVAFVSIPVLAPPPSSGGPTVYVRDRLMSTTETVSLTMFNSHAFGDYPAISADGRFVAFASPTPSIVNGDTNNIYDVFVYDRQTSTSERVSVDSSGAEGNGGSFESAISADGRFVAFGSGASNLVAGDTNGFDDVFVHDRQTGTTERVSVSSMGDQADATSSFNSAGAISADGRFVTFWSNATNLVTDDTNGQSDVFVHDRQTGTTERVSVSSSGAEANSDSHSPTISADGRFVAFVSLASNIDVLPGPNPPQDIFIHDRQTGTTHQVSRDPAGHGANYASFKPAISADGHVVAFFSDATNLAAGDTNDFKDIYVAEPACGDGAVDFGEDCDDGNTLNGDCCSSTCGFETSGSACPGDGNGCTDDECNGSGGCVHPPNSAPCNDTLFCNGGDTCAGGTCSVHAGDPCAGGPECVDHCNETADNCLTQAGFPCTDDGNGCTDDQCDGSGGCGHPPNTAPCDDGLFCNGTDTCSGGSCTVHAGDPCVGGGQCADLCNESADTCVVPDGTSCTDGNACTQTDTCQGGTCTGTNPVICTALDQCHFVGACDPLNGSCSEPVKPNASPCDDGDACTQADSCIAGSCAGNPPVCGDGIAVAGCEQCDDGNTNDKDACKTNCMPNVCGDGVVHTGVEECDDGGSTNGDGCDELCVLEPETFTDPSVPPGGSLSSDTGATGATASEPVQAAVTTPTGGSVTITRTSSSTQTPGFLVLTGIVHVDAPPAASASDPLVLVFQLDASLIPANEDETTIQISKDGSPVDACTGGAGEASPDPCVSNRALLAGGDVELTVLTTTASDWGFAVSLCPRMPSGDCKSAETGLLLVKKSSPDTEDAVVWKWKRGVAGKDEFGSPLTTTDYALCVYDEASNVASVKLQPVVAHGGLCSGRPCWKETRTGFRYRHTALTPDGKLRVLLSEGLVAGKGKIVVSGKGTTLGVPALPFVQGAAVTAELRSSDGRCWGATYSTHIANDTGRFKAISD